MGQTSVSMPVLTLALRHSLLLRLLLFVGHLAPLVALYSANVSNWVRMAVLACVAISGLWHWREIRRQAGSCLELLSSGEVLLHRRGDAVPVEIGKPHVDWGWLIVLSWQEISSQRRGRHAFTSEAFPSHRWRDLRTWLRWRPEVPPSLP